VCVDVTWEAKARARHQLESPVVRRPEESQLPVVDGSGLMRKCH
jgi:hypothetical protein